MADADGAERGASSLFAQLQSAAPFFVMAGPNVVESREHALKMARQLKLVSDSLGLQLVFKASFDKANRTSAGAFRGPGLEDGLRVLDEVRTSTGLDIVTDIHEPWQAEPVAQTDLLQAAGATHRVVHLKKGQWCAPAVASAAAVKLHAAGAAGVVLCDRGTQFGYTDLVMDVRNIEEMRPPAGQLPNVLISADVTHALQRPCGQVHDDPQSAPVDGPTQWPLRALRPLLRELMAISAASRARGRAGREPSLCPAGDDWTPDDEDESTDDW